jgi:type IV pilus assembly protein PilQ
MTLGHSRAATFRLAVVMAAVVSVGLIAAPPQAPSQPNALVGQGSLSVRKYAGSPITLDLQGADLRAVLRSLADISGLNIVIDPAVKGSVDIKLTDVPWDQALEVILKSSRLGYAIDGAVIRVAPLDVLATEQADLQKLADAEAPASLEVRTIALNYAQASKIEPLLRSAILSKFGQTQFDERTNTLVIRDRPDRLQAAADLIKVLDRPEPQVEIEARIVETDHNAARELGVKWGLTGAATPALGNTTSLGFPNSITASGAIDTVGTAVNLPASQPTSAIGLALGAVNGAFGLDLALSALQTSGKGRILSTPKVTTQNNQLAEVMQGVQIPIQTVSNNTVTVTFKDAALSLKVTPQITSAGTVIMRIELENATADFTRAVNNIPPIDTQRAITQVQVPDGATTVIGGIVVNREQSTTDRTPALSNVPLLGWLFRHDAKQDSSTELLIFITPRIIRSAP